MDKWIGKNVLYRVHQAGHESDVHEGTVKRFSPSKRCVEIGHQWHMVEKIEVLEEIPGRRIPNISVAEMQQPGRPGDDEKKQPATAATTTASQPSQN